MDSSLHLADHLLVGLSIALSLVFSLLTYPCAVRRIDRGVAGARLGLYGQIVASAWALVGCAIALWCHASRPWPWLGLDLGTPLGLGAGLVLVAGFATLVVVQRRAVLARPEVMARLADRFAQVAPLVPHTGAERWAFVGVSLTAGICEELFYRGFLLWYATALVGPVAGVLASSVLFGFDHAYLGRSHILRTGVVGLLFAGLVLLSGSLWAAMIIHAAMDLASGDLGHRALAARRAAPPHDVALT